MCVKCKWQREGKMLIFVYIHDSMLMKKLIIDYFLLNNYNLCKKIAIGFVNSILAIRFQNKFATIKKLLMHGYAQCKEFDLGMPELTVKLTHFRERFFEEKPTSENRYTMLKLLFL